MTRRQDIQPSLAHAGTNPNPQPPYPGASGTSAGAGARVRSPEHLKITGYCPACGGDTLFPSTPVAATVPYIGILGETLEDAKAEGERLITGNRILPLSVRGHSAARRLLLDALFVTPRATRSPRLALALADITPAMATRPLKDQP